MADAVQVNAESERIAEVRSELSDGHRVRTLVPMSVLPAVTVRVRVTITGKHHGAD